MIDRLVEAYEAWKKTVTEPTQLQAFQAGWSAGAASLRARAMDVVRSAKQPTIDNESINKIGELPDVPTE